MDKTPKQQPVFRKDRGDPCEDFWHTLMIGVPIAAVLFLILPPIFRGLRYLIG